MSWNRGWAPLLGLMALSRAWACTNVGEAPEVTEPLGRLEAGLTSTRATLVRDINTVGRSKGSEPYYPTVVGSTVYFSAETPARGRELWKSDGTETGTVLVKDIHPGSASSSPSSLINFKGTLFFTADDGVHGSELWKTDGTPEGTVLVKDINPGTSGSSAYSLMARGTVLYFVADDGFTGAELWKSDGTEAGTVLVKDIHPGTAKSSPYYLTDAGGMLVFTADDGVHGSEPWTSDGTSAGTVLLKDIHPGTTSSYPLDLIAMKGWVYFSANDPSTGWELWKSDGTEAGTVLLEDIDPGTRGSFPSDLIVMNDVLYFVASDPVSFDELWRSDGTAAGTYRVSNIAPGLGGSYPSYLTVVNGVLYFEADDDVTGEELWKSDGTEAGTVLVKDLLAGTGNAEPSSLTAVDGTLFFTAVQATTGRELWKSDGTATGTVLVKDIWPGASGALLGMPLFPLTGLGMVLFEASDGVSGVELWRSDGTAAGTVLVQDILPGSGSSNPAEFTRVGPLVYFRAEDSRGQEPWVVNAEALLDETPPTITCPGPVVAEATGPSGAQVSLPAATARDNQAASPRVTYSPASGNTFPLGATTVTATATDGAGFSASCTFQVTVRDTTPPSCPPATFTAEATSSQGATVYLPSSTFDAVSWGTPSYTPASGSLFPPGSTQVSATVTDRAGNTTSCALTAVVRDTTAPGLTCPSTQSVEATGPEGAAVSFPPPVTSDAVSTPTVTFSPASGSTLALGTHSVSVTSTDATGNQRACSFSVVVRDTTPPQVTCPGDQRVTTTSDTGARVDYPSAQASDAVTPSPALTVDHPSGSLFPVGETLVTVRTTDEAGNASQCSFKVAVSKQASQPDPQPTPNPNPNPEPKPTPPEPEPGETPPAQGCGCTSSSAGVSATWSLLLLASAISRRRRSHKRLASPM